MSGPTDENLLAVELGEAARRGLVARLEDRGLDRMAEAVAVSLPARLDDRGLRLAYGPGKSRACAFVEREPEAVQDVLNEEGVRLLLERVDW